MERSKRIDAVIIVILVSAYAATAFYLMFG